MRRAALDGQPSWRVIAARHPPITLFELVASREDFEALYELEAAFSPHYDEITLLQYLPRSKWVFGPGSGYIMAPFAYLTSSRFTDGTFGVYYAAMDEETAIREVAFHRGIFMSRTHEPASALEEQILIARISGELVDIRGQQASQPTLYAPDPLAYGPAQAFGASLRGAGETGIAFSSVRNAGGECVGIFRPRAVKECHQVRPLRYVWDGAKIAGWA
ncbi:RES family NAD+ phosphorylase [Mesoterricola silvestris]|uniref:RES domain-containing protein n=1 Tax=Mesoterricola silvestris TaxID=2927979 RepID=A0AA48GY74_9BACT|nr:RES family NAD+ phosphorylase [Mesoterricola silvestris]BDU74056.1 hypothetical protein METEAL_32300 [Mesoterricola silvestris]